MNRHPDVVVIGGGPQTPVAKNSRKAGLTSHRPSGAVSAAKKPSTKQPLTFTSSVPHGNVSPSCRATTPAAQKRAMLPSAPPRAIQR